MMTMAKAKIQTDERRRAEARRNNYWMRNIDWLCINNNGRGLGIVVNRSRMGDNNRRGSRHVNNLRRCRNVNRSRLHGVTDDVNGGDAGEDFADRGPFTISGGGGLNTGSSKSGQAKDCYRVFHIIVFHFDCRCVGPAADRVYSAGTYP